MVDSTLKQVNFGQDHLVIETFQLFEQRFDENDSRSIVLSVQLTAVEVMISQVRSSVIRPRTNESLTVQQA